jgi:LmbE family N-acetylglucosaminyl deacetylase
MQNPGPTDSRTPLATPERALTIGAHPDDAEFGAGATLARWADTGCVTTIAVVTDGSKGTWDPDMDPADLAEQRRNEQDAAAAVLGGAAVVHIGAVDGELEYSMELRRELCGIIRRYQPDVVLSHDPWQRYQIHPDHRVTGLLAVDAVVAARDPLFYPDAGGRPHRPKALLLWSAEEPDHAEPTTKRWLDVKIDALLQHQSQTKTTMAGALSSPDAREGFARRIRRHAAEAGVVFGMGEAETFKWITP